MACLADWFPRWLSSSATALAVGHCAQQLLHKAEGTAVSFCSPAQFDVWDKTCVDSLLILSPVLAAQLAAAEELVVRQLVRWVRDKLIFLLPVIKQQYPLNIYWPEEISSVEREGEHFHCWYASKTSKTLRFNIYNALAHPVAARLSFFLYGLDPDACTSVQIGQMPPIDFQEQGFLFDKTVDFMPGATSVELAYKGMHVELTNGDIRPLLFRVSDCVLTGEEGKSYCAGAEAFQSHSFAGLFNCLEPEIDTLRAKLHRNGCFEVEGLFSTSGNGLLCGPKTRYHVSDQLYYSCNTISDNMALEDRGLYILVANRKGEYHA